MPAAVAIPEDDPIVTKAVLLLLHTPPEGLSLSVVGEEVQILVLPDIAPGAVGAFTVTIEEDVPEQPEPLLSV